jgi:hypothetical protein
MNEMKFHQEAIAGTSPICRYMSLHEFLTLIVRKKLIFRQFEDLWRNDIKEGRVPQRFWEAYEALNPVSATGSAEAREQNDRRLNILRLQTYVSCWHLASENENALMWSSYAPRGVMIKTNVEKLKAATRCEQNGSIQAEEMTYADDWTGLREQGFSTDGTIIPNRLFLNRKRRMYKIEQEIRFGYSETHWETTPAGAWIALPEKLPKWSERAVRDFEWIDEVVVGGDVTPWSVETLKTLMTDSNIPRSKVKSSQS